MECAAALEDREDQGDQGDRVVQADPAPLDVPVDQEACEVAPPEVLADPAEWAVRVEWVAASRKCGSNSRQRSARS